MTVRGDGFEDRAADTGNGPGTREWWAEWRAWVGDTLLGGYATLDYPKALPPPLARRWMTHPRRCGSIRRVW